MSLFYGHSIKFFFPAIHCPNIEGILSEHMTHRLLSGRLEEYGSMVMLECSSGYYLGVGHRTLRCLANGTWEGSDDPATCKSKYYQKHQHSNVTVEKMKIAS